MQLFDCGHIIKVEEMDIWMLRELGNDVQLMRCPKCSTSITFSYRYGNIIKRSLMNIENVKTTIQEIVDEVIDSARHQGSVLTNEDLMSLKFPPTLLRLVQSYPGRSHRLDLRHRHTFMHGRNVVFIFTLKNHLKILHQAHKTGVVLRKIGGFQANLQKQMGELWDAINGALTEIKQYLERPQLDLKTLSQVHQQTKKFFLFSRVLEVQSESMRCQIPLSSTGTTRVKLACDRFAVFLKGNDDALALEWLWEIVKFLRNEVNLPLLTPEEATDFANFPGYQRGIWKLCDQGHVYFSGWIVRGGDDIPVGSEGCTRCTTDG